MVMVIVKNKLFKIKIMEVNMEKKENEVVEV